MEVLKINIEKIISVTPKRDALFGDNVKYRELFNACVYDKNSAMEKLASYSKEDLWDFILFMHYMCCSNCTGVNSIASEMHAYKILRDTLLSTDVSSVSYPEDSICFI